MGSGSYSSKDWSDFSTSRGYHKATTKTSDIYASRDLHEDLDPKKFTVRESVDSDDNPNSTPIILGLDVTGSMGRVLDRIARQGLKTVCEEIFSRKPVSDAHVAILGIGDVLYDRAPFQATQFEADVRIFEHLEKLFLEGGGGANDSESYILAWYFAKYRTSIDSFNKRGQKGFIFTIGDEEITPKMSSQDISRFFGDTDAQDFTAKSLYEAVYPEWNIYHIIIKETAHASHNFESVKNSWEDVIGAQRVIPLEDFTALGETIVSVLEVANGKPIEKVVNSWEDAIAVAVSGALVNVEDSRPKVKSLDAVL